MKYRARCLSCGKPSDELTEKPGRYLTISSRGGHANTGWLAGRTIPDSLPLVVLCRDCLGLRAKAS